MEQVITLIQQLASKLGATAEQLWPYYVGYYRWLNVAYLIQDVIVIALSAWAAARYSRYLFDLTRIQRGSLTDREVGTAIVFGIGALILICFGLTAFFNIPSAMGGIAFPEGKIVADAVSAVSAKK